MQIANFCATIANRGWFITPHLVKSVKGQGPDTLYTKKRLTPIDSSFYKYVVEGMRGATSIGTAQGVLVPGIEICGKTGTAQNSAGPDHSIFMCFAPAQKPRIALVVFIENGGFGATWAVPTASLILEKYLKGSVDKHRLWMEQRLLNANLMKFVPN